MNEDQSAVHGIDASNFEAKKKIDRRMISAMAHALGITHAEMKNVLKSKETTGVLRTEHQTVQPRKITAADD